MIFYYTVEEIKLRDFPWDKVAWAVDENGSPYIPRHVTPEASVLILWKDDKRVAYLVYDVSYKVGQVEIHYVHTPYQRKGYATKLMNEISRRHNSQYEIHAYSTSDIAEHLLTKCGFERADPGQTKWVRRPAREGV
ncbi:MAG: hypothetical protein AMJ73_02955 [candidate division Zixibacteria bacterium SM1_73]|nr:MAG: hypothetical protein AMJ73_02955 [candidate division Zixibacteria bacterium SM1_73]